MNNVFFEVLLIISIFAVGITLCLTVNLWIGIGFILIANIALPTMIKLAQMNKLNTYKL